MTDVTKLYMALQEAQEFDPDIVMIMKTPGGTVRCKIGESLIYIGIDGMTDEIVIDSE